MAENTRHHGGGTPPRSAALDPRLDPARMAELEGDELSGYVKEACHLDGQMTKSNGD